MDNIRSSVSLNVTYPEPWGGDDGDFLQPVKATYDTETNQYTVEFEPPSTSGVIEELTCEVVGETSGIHFSSLNSVGIHTFVRLRFKDTQDVDVAYRLTARVSNVDETDTPLKTGVAIISANI